MALYLIAFNDEWTPDLTLEELRERGKSGKAVIDEMTAAGAFISRRRLCRRGTGARAKPQRGGRARWGLDLSNATATRCARRRRGRADDRSTLDRGAAAR